MSASEQPDTFSESMTPEELTRWLGAELKKRGLQLEKDQQKALIGEDELHVLLSKTLCLCAFPIVACTPLSESNNAISLSSRYAFCLLILYYG